MLNVGLISCHNRFNEFPIHYTLGTLRLAAKLLWLGGINVYIFPVNSDCFDDPEIDSLIDDLTKKKIDVIGLSLYSWTIDICKEIRRRIRCDTSIEKVVLGGPCAEFVNTTDWFGDEHIVLGEGEAALAEYCQTLLHGARGLLTSSPCAEILEDVFNNTEPLYSSKMLDIMQKERVADFLWYETTRGCMYNCAYCAHKSRRNVAGFSLSFIEQEVVNIGNLKPIRAFIVDPILGGTVTRGKAILELFCKYSPNTALIFYMRFEHLDEDYIELIKNTNIHEMRVGIQSLNQNIPSFIRSNSIESIYRGAHLLRKYNISWRGELIIGLPGDNLKGLLDTLKKMIDELKPSFLFAYHLSVIDGSALSKLLQKGCSTGNSLWIKRDENNCAHSSSSYTHKELLKMLVIGNAVTSFYNHHTYRVSNETINTCPPFAVVWTLLKALVEQINFEKLDGIKGYTYTDFGSMWSKSEFKMQQ